MPLLVMRLVILTSLSSPAIAPSELSRYNETSQYSAGFLFLAPLNNRFSSFCARMLLADVVPSMNTSASMIFDFPLPLGPATQLNPSGNGIVTLPAKLLNPAIVMRSSLTIVQPLHFFMDGAIDERRNGRVLVTLVPLHQLFQLFQKPVVYAHNCHDITL